MHDDKRARTWLEKTHRLVYVRLHLEKSDEPIFDWVDANEIKLQAFSFAVTFPFWVVFSHIVITDSYLESRFLNFRSFFPLSFVLVFEGKYIISLLGARHAREEADKGTW